MPNAYQKFTEPQKRKQMTAKKQKAKKPQSRVFKMGLTIPRYGRVETGDEATVEALKCLEAAGVKSELYVK